jgi:hypothetical protein
VGVRGEGWGEGPLYSPRGATGRGWAAATTNGCACGKALANGRGFDDVWAVQGSDVGGQTSAGDSAGVGRERVVERESFESVRFSQGCKGFGGGWAWPAVGLGKRGRESRGRGLMARVGPGVEQGPAK